MLLDMWEKIVWNIHLSLKGKSEVQNNINKIRKKNKHLNINLQGEEQNKLITDYIESNWIPGFGVEKTSFSNPQSNRSHKILT